MRDISILYYTANRISDTFATAIRDILLYQAARFGIPIISVSQKPIDFGDNICVGDIGYSTYNVYKQILVGAKKVRTKYLVCCEDDSLYSPEHFQYRPPEDTFAYDLNRWNVRPNFYYYRKRRPGMCMCIAPTELMVKTLEIRFEKYPNQESADRMKMGMAEPGRKEKEWGLPPVKAITFESQGIANLTFRHGLSLSISRSKVRSDIRQPELPGWGNAKDLWQTIHG